LQYIQYDNPLTKHWSKRSTQTLSVADVREDGKPSEGAPTGSHHSGIEIVQFCI